MMDERHPAGPLLSATAKVEHQDRVDKLKRRIQKLNTKLEETEDLLERVKAGGQVDVGIASEFRTAQGLKSEAAYFEEKKMLLKEIFSLNMDLKKLMAETS